MTGFMCQGPQRGMPCSCNGLRYDVPMAFVRHVMPCDIFCMNEHVPVVCLLGGVFFSAVCATLAGSHVFVSPRIMPMPIYHEHCIEQRNGLQDVLNGTTAVYRMLHCRVSTMAFLYSVYCLPHGMGWEWTVLLPTRKSASTLGHLGPT